MTISRKKAVPKPPPPPPRREQYVPKARFNAAGLILDSARGVNALLDARGLDAKSPEGQRALELAGLCLANGGEVKDAIDAASNWLLQQLGPPPETPSTPPPAGLTLVQAADDDTRKAEVDRQLREFRIRMGVDPPDEDPFEDIPF